MVRDTWLKQPRFQEFVRRIQHEIQHLPSGSQGRAALQAESRDLENQIQGWLQSLGNPTLAASLRKAIEAQYTQAEQRLHEISSDLLQLTVASNQQAVVLNPQIVVDRLKHLAQILSGQNASATNLLLSQHIAGIDCHPEGKVVVRTCKLGALAEALDDVLSVNGSLPNCETVAPFAGKPRRRGRRDVGTAIEDDEFVTSANQFGTDPERYAGLGANWFTDHVFHVPRRISWPEAHAREVAQYRLDTAASMEVTAAHFGKTPPTIRKALQFAKDLHGMMAFGKAVSDPSKPYWARDQADQVAEFHAANGGSLKRTAEHFGRCETTIKKALGFAQALDSEVGRTAGLPADPLGSA